MNAPLKLPNMTLDDKYRLDSGRVYVTGQQAIVRLMLVQRLIDEKAGLNTGGFISGYRGSPMTAPEFRAKLQEAFEGEYKIKYHLSPPLLAKKDPHTGQPRKYEIGGWITPIFKIMAKMSALRGTAFDIFGYTEERKMERGLIKTYEETVDSLILGLNQDNHKLAIDIASFPDAIRGYGFIKEKSVKDATTNLNMLLSAYQEKTTTKASA